MPGLAELNGPGTGLGLQMIVSVSARGTPGDSRSTITSAWIGGPCLVLTDAGVWILWRIIYLTAAGYER